MHTHMHTHTHTNITVFKIIRFASSFAIQNRLSCWAKLNFASKFHAEDPLNPLK